MKKYISAGEIFLGLDSYLQTKYSCNYQINMYMCTQVKLDTPVKTNHMIDLITLGNKRQPE